LALATSAGVTFEPALVVVDVVPPAAAPPLGAVDVVEVVLVVLEVVEVVDGVLVVVLWVVVVLLGTVAAVVVLDVVEVWLWAWLLPPQPARARARTATSAPMRSLLKGRGLLLGSFGSECTSAQVSTRNSVTTSLNVCGRSSIGT
jgi:hypothetical protein